MPPSSCSSRREKKLADLYARLRQIDAAIRYLENVQLSQKRRSLALARQVIKRAA